MGPNTEVDAVRPTGIASFGVAGAGGSANGGGTAGKQLVGHGGPPSAGGAGGGPWECDTPIR